jgi:hypothetical protein
MGNLEKSEIEELKKRIEVLENRFQYLSDLLVQVGKEIGTAGNNVDYATEAKVEKGFTNTTVEPEVKDDGGELTLSNAYKDFIEKYASGSTGFDFYLDVGRDLIKDLKFCSDWTQVSDEVKERLYLEEAYDSNSYYADCKQINDEFLYLVAPSEPDVKYSQREFIMLALPYFFNITYLHSSEMEGKFLKLEQPAVFLQDEKGGFILRTRGKVILSK